jgi:hypothetical protein
MKIKKSSPKKKPRTVLEKYDHLKSINKNLDLLKNTFDLDLAL